MPKNPLVLPLAEYAPDLPSEGGSSLIKNVYPRALAPTGDATALSYGPVNDMAQIYDALTARCRGGAAFRDKQGNTFIFAGDATDLYNMKAGLAAWDNVSKSAAAYSTSEFWRFAYFNGDVVATNFADQPQVYTLSSSTDFSDLPDTPPRARYAAVVKNAFLVFGNTYDATNGEMPQRVWWSSAGNHRSWPTLGSDAAAAAQSGATDLLGPAGWVMGFAPDLINAEAIVFQQYGVRRMAYSGPPSTFTFLPVESARGCLCPDSIVVYGGIAYYWGIDGIYAFDGAQSRAIGANRVDKTVYADLDPNNTARVVGAADPVNKLIWWAYPSRDASSGNPDRILIYNWHLDKFSLAELTCETILRLQAIGYTLDQLETVLGYATVDEIPAPLSSEVWTGGRLFLGLFDTTHTLSMLTGTPLAATVETQEMEAMPGRRVLVTGSRPLVDINVSGGSVTPSVSIGRRERKQSDLSYTAAVALNALGACPVRTSGRHLRAKITIPAGSQYWGHISGLSVDIVPQGSR